jgi:pullulanase-type alpha-1,6-glucosidase
MRLFPLARGVQLVCALALVLGLLAVPAAVSPPAQASSTPTRVTVPGSFNGEIGCTNGDWSPSCNGAPGSIPTTPNPLQANDLTNQGNGVWAREISVPASGAPYEYKVALNGDWAESYAGRPTNNGNTTLGITQTTAVKFYFDTKTDFVADNFNQTIYTVPGNFNSELGCTQAIGGSGGDWEPPCLRTLMSDTDGDGVYTFKTTEIPAGSYEFKIASDELWNTPNYGQNGGGNNIPFTVPVNGLEVTFSFDDATNVPSVAVAVPPPPEDAALLRTPVTDPNQDEVFYFVLPDRFANGSTANDRGGDTGDTTADILRHGFKPDDKGYYNGGDLVGLKDKLPYLKQLGITAIWMTPVLKNKAVQGDGITINGSSAGYHGYWILDFSQIDPHLGTNQDLKDLIAAAKGEGIKIFFDIITNHTADVIDYESKNYDYISRGEFSYRDAGGNRFDDREFANDPDFPALNRYSFPKRPVFRTPTDSAVKVPAWLNDPTMYHNRGDTNFDGSEKDFYGDFFGLDDLFTERPQVVDGMTEIYKDLITEFKIDGFRVDTVKHVNVEFWQEFVPEVKAHAAAQGVPEFFIFGEVFSGDPSFTSYYTDEGRFPAVLDFGFQGAAGNFAVGSAATNQLKGFFEGDDYYTSPTNNAYNLPTFLGNHDIGRIGSRMQTVTADLSDDERVARMTLAHALMFTARGIPIVYYGDEQGFTGPGGDKDARQTMFASQVTQYATESRIGGGSGASDSFNQAHPLYVAIAELAALRKAHPALQKGAQIQRFGSDQAGIFAFSRIDRSEKVEYVVAFNNSETSKSATIRTFRPNTTFEVIYSTADGLVNEVASGAGDISIDLPGLSAVVYKQLSGSPAVGLAQAPLGPITVFTEPISGTSVAGLLEVEASLAAPAFAEVSFAVSVNGGAYQPLGTDTNAPYRIFYDTAGLPNGTRLSFKAVSTDLLGAEGNFNSATTSVTKGVTGELCEVDYEFAIVHYYRPDGNYNGWTAYPFGSGVSGSYDYNSSSIPFIGRTDYGAFALIPLSDPSAELGVVIHNNADGSDEKDPTADLEFVPRDTPQVFIKAGDNTVYPSQAAAQGYVRFHYNGADPDAVLYVFGQGAAASETANSYPGSRKFTGTAGAFRYVDVQVGDPTKDIGFIVVKSDGAKDPDGDRFVTPAKQAAVWLKTGEAKVNRSLSEAENVVTLHYHRPAGDYGNYASTDFNDFWGLHLWENGTAPEDRPARWQEPFKPNLPQDSFGVNFRVRLNPGATTWAYILHKGDEKDKPADQILNLTQDGHEIWVYQNMPGEWPYLIPVQPGCTLGDGNQAAKQKAYWLSGNTIGWDIIASPTVTYTLHYDPNGGLSVNGNAIDGGMSIQLTLDESGLPAAVKSKFPHLKSLTALKVAEADLPKVKEILKGEMLVAARSPDGSLIEVTGLQIPGVLDDLFATAAKPQTLGVSYPAGATSLAQAAPTLKLWAPTATDVNLLVFPDATSTATETVEMSFDAASGIWSATGDASWNGKHYLYEVKVFVPATDKVETNLVTDPYAVALSMNSKRSIIVDLNAAALKPAGWDGVNKPRLDAFEDIVLYELHVRDFSITDETVPAAARGTYKAFTYGDSAGMRHLSGLARDGLTHIHLLPVFDIASIEEDKTKREEPDPAILAAGTPGGETQQAEVNRVRDKDGFNWGYDPYHYNVPEGSYSTNPEGTTRIVEFREMVAGLNNTGLRVVMDVVYNHTAQAGQGEKSVLDRIVPGYYHRLNGDGGIETSTCCQNTATEHTMMEKLMIDSLVLWAKAYKVDGFRFDLMGHHMKSNMVNVRAALDALTVADDGVDGSKIYVYGEGWNFGEVVDGIRGPNATQRNLPGTGIGTFSDRLRDAVRGGGPFDSGEDSRKQGFITGLFTDPNSLNQGTADEQKARLLAGTDLIKVGLAGNLAQYQIVNAQGNTVKGEDIDYNGSPGGYTQDPQEVITYIEAHDNETLFDAIQSKVEATTTLTDRVRIQNLGISIVMLGQGIPFFQAGQDFLRSKSGDRNSYNSGDWFNRVDWELNESTWGSGLPIRGDNLNNWSVFKPLLENPALKPGRNEMVTASEHFRTMLRIRKSSPLFRLQTASEVNNRLTFLNNGTTQTPGLIVMRLQDTGTTDIDPLAEQIVVLFNANDEAVTFTAAELAGAGLRLHPQLALSDDATLAGASYNPATGTFTVPPRTTVVYSDLLVVLRLPMMRLP